MAVVCYAGNNFTGLSSDTKPAVPDGSRFLETDTGDLFLRISGAWVYSTEQGIFNGLVDNTKFTVSYDESTRVFTLTIASGAVVWAGKKKYTPAADTYVQTAHDDTTALYYLFFDGDDGSIAIGTSVDFITDAIVAYVYYNATTNKGVLFDERHPNTWPNDVHRHFHTTVGARLVSGGVISGYTLDTNGVANLQLAIEQTVIDDESLRTTLTALSAGGPYTVWYRSGSDENNEWSWDITPTIPIVDDGDDPYYNLLSTGTWGNSAIASANKWVNVWLFATNAYNDSGDNYKHRFVFILGQAVHSSLASAQGESVLTSIQWGSHVPFAELVPLYRLTFKRVSDVTEKNIQLDEILKIIGTQISATSLISPTSHNSLSGRSDAGAHPGLAISLDTGNFDGNLSATDINVQTALETLDELVTGASTAAAITVETTSFSGNLSASDDTVQSALETIDALVLGDSSIQASEVSVLASGFSGNLSTSDTDIQTALATIDALILGESSTQASEVSVLVSGFSGNLSASDTNVQSALDTIDALTIPTTAAEISVWANSFSGNLSATDTNVQSALETLDAMVAGAAFPYTFEGTAGETLSQYDVVYPNPDDAGEYWIATNDGTDIQADATAIVIEEGGITAGSTGTFVRIGPVTNAAWSLTPGAGIFLGTNGIIVDEMPSSIYAKPLGEVKESADTIWFEPQIGWEIGDSTSNITASIVSVFASGFSGNLSATDIDVQTALETIDTLNLGVSTAAEVSVLASGFSGNLSVTDTDVQSALETLDSLSIEVVPFSDNDGRLTLVSTEQIKWDGYRIVLWDPAAGRDVVVIPSSVPTLDYDDDDLDEDALVAAYPYDIFAEFSSATAFTLVAKKWTNATTRAVSPALWHGRYRYDNSTDNGKKRLWLGTVYLDTGPVFVHSASAGKCYIYNVYNKQKFMVVTKNSNTTWTYTTNTWRECNAGTGQQRAQFVLGEAVDVDMDMVISWASTVGRYCYTSINADSTSGTPDYYSYNYIDYGLTKNSVVAYPKSLSVGFHYATLVENAFSSGEVYVYGGACGLGRVHLWM